MIAVFVLLILICELAMAIRSQWREAFVFCIFLQVVNIAGAVFA